MAHGFPQSFLKTHSRYWKTYMQFTDHPGCAMHQTELYVHCLMLSATSRFYFPLLLSPFINEETEIQRSEACFPKY